MTTKLRPTGLIYALVPAILSLPACLGPHAYQRDLTRGGGQHIVGFMEAYSPPTGVSKAAIADEADLERVTATEVCVRLVIRTAVDDDLPLETLDMTLDGTKVYPVDRSVEVRDHGFYELRSSRRGRTHRVDQNYAVYERHGLVCAPRRQDQDRVQLRIDHPHQPGIVYSWSGIGERVAAKSVR